MNSNTKLIGCSKTNKNGLGIYGPSFLLMPVEFLLIERIMMYFCRPTQKLVSPPFPQQNHNLIVPLAFGLLCNINSVAYKSL